MADRPSEPRRLSDNLLAVVVVHLDRVDGADPRRELRVQLLAVGNLDDEHVVGFLLAADEVGFPVVHVFLEPVPLRDTLIHPDAGVPIEFNAHATLSTRRYKAVTTSDRSFKHREDRPAAMTTVWLVDRQFDSKGLVRLTYATEDGARVHTKELAEQRLVTGDGVTAGRDVDEDALGESPDDEVDRFAAEASRMAAEHDPDDVV